MWWKCKHMKIYSKRALLEDAFAQTLSEKTKCSDCIKGWAPSHVQFLRKKFLEVHPVAARGGWVLPNFFIHFKD
jgi:hypothetical protein